MIISDDAKFGVGQLTVLNLILSHKKITEDAGLFIYS